MCIEIVIATDRRLPINSDSECSTYFHVEEIAPHDALHGRIARHTALPYIHVATSHTGCGCGFQGTDNADAELDPDVPKAQLALATYLRARLNEGWTIELLVCWTGKEAIPPKYPGMLVPESIGRDKKQFREGEVFRVVCR